jgi:phosphatidate cytidylyltransferase
LKNEFRSRLLIAFCGFFLFTVATFLQFESTFFFLCAVWTFSFLEIVNMMQINDLMKNVYFFFSVLIFFLCFYCIQLPGNTFSFVFAIIWLITILFLCFLPKEKHKHFSFLYMVYLTLPIVYLVDIRKFFGAPVFFLLLLIIWTLDVFSYCFGVSLGKHLIAPKISPNISLIIVGCILFPVFGFLGDLFESSIKREYNKKDSGSILLGHGGFLDRFDSLLFTAIIFGTFIRFL